MSQILKLTHENQQLKRQVSQYKQVLGVSPFVDDSLLKGGYRVVKTIEDRDKIGCCHRKQGMKVVVVGDDLSFKEYILKSKQCSENIWEEINVTIDENEVFLTEDYSELGGNLSTQKDLNLVLKQILQNLQTQINNIELTDEKVQITENTDFAQVGENQKIFNKNVSIYKNNNDLKNQEQDDRLTNIEGINYTWSPTNRTLTLFDKNGVQMSQVSLVSLDNEGTDLRYNASTLSLELYNVGNNLLDSIPVSSFIGSVGTQLQLNSNQLQLKDSQGNVLSTVSFTISNIQGLQTALDAKLNKPTTIGNTTTYPFVVGEDGNGNSARLPAGDLGKNFFNSDLSNTTARNHTMNAGVTVNTLGNPYSITGLPDRASDTTNFDKVLKYNPTTGQFAYGNAFVYNVPSTITVNHVNTPASPNVPSYVQAIQDKITEIHTTAVFQNFNNWTIETLNNLTHSGINVQNNKTVHTNISPFRGIAGISSGQNVINIKTQRILPSNSNWAIKFDFLMATNSSGAYSNYGAAACRNVGIYSDGGSLINPDFYVRDWGGDYSHNETKLSGDNQQYFNSRQIGYNQTLRCLILKINTQVLIQVSWGTLTISKIYDIQTLVNNNTSFGFLIDAYSLLDTGNPYDNYNALVDNIQYAILS